MLLTWSAPGSSSKPCGSLLTASRSPPPPSTLSLLALSFYRGAASLRGRVSALGGQAWRQTGCCGFCSGNRGSAEPTLSSFAAKVLLPVQMLKVGGSPSSRWLGPSGVCVCWPPLNTPATQVFPACTRIFLAWQEPTSTM